MIRERLLLDTNAYLRLAQPLDPLLNQPFGPDTARLFVIREFEKEFSCSPRLQENFAWVREEKYVINRRRPVPIPRDKKRPISITASTLLEHVRSEGLAVSPVDQRALATGKILNMTVVTDDKDMRKVAHVFKIETMRTLVLVKRMLRESHIDMVKVKEIALYWQSANDCPADFYSDYRRIFGEAAPRC